MRRVLGEAGDRHVRAIVARRTEVTSEEFELMRRQAMLLSKAAQRRPVILRSFRRCALHLSMSAQAGMSLKEITEMPAVQRLNMARSSPSMLRSWLWGEASVEPDQVAALVEGTARHLLKASRRQLKSIMTPLSEEVYRSEKVIWSALRPRVKASLAT